MQITNKSWLRKDFGQSSIQLLSSFCISHSSIHPSIQLYLMAGDAFIQGRPGPGQWDLPSSVFVWCVKYTKYCIKCIVQWDRPSLGATIWSLFLPTSHHSRITAVYSDHSIDGSGSVRIKQISSVGVKLWNMSIRAQSDGYRCKIWSEVNPCWHKQNTALHEFVLGDYQERSLEMIYFDVLLCRNWVQIAERYPPKFILLWISTRIVTILFEAPK